jgi:hypothetical protein
MNLNNIIWCKQGIQIGEGKTFNTNILPTELNKQTEFEMIITPKDGQPQLTAIEHYAEPYSPVPWDTGTGTLPKDDSLRILSVRDLRWKTITDKFYVNDSQGGDILKPQKVNKGNPIMGYGVEFNLNTDNLTCILLTFFNLFPHQPHSSSEVIF